MRPVSIIRQRITTAMAMLPASIAVAVVVWIAWGPHSVASGAGCLLAVLTALSLRVVSNTLQLIRVRSWAVSSVFVLLTAICAPIHQWELGSMLAGVLYLVHVSCLLFLTRTKNPQVCVFVSTAALACLMVFVPKAIWLLLPALFSMVVLLRAASGRSLMAVLFGLLLPAEVWVAWVAYDGELLSHWQELSGDLVSFSFSGFSENVAAMPLLNAAVYGFLLFFSVVAVVHYLRTSLNDKTETRMHYFTLILQWPVLMLFVAHSLNLPGVPAGDRLLPIVALCTSPLISHYLVFARGWWANIMFYLFLLSCLFLAFRPL